MKRLIASCLGLGRLPYAPGTWGSLPPVIIFLLVQYFGTAAFWTPVVMATTAVLASVLCLRYAPSAIAATGRLDPSEVVLDEVAGQALTLLFVSTITKGPILTTAAVGFVLFRLFDIVKPWPARSLEKLPKAWGVLADDLMAGVYAGIALLICSRSGLVDYLAASLDLRSGSLNISTAALLGAVQGATEFLPVSSSGHLVLFEKLLDFDPETPRMLLFDLAVHVGTIAAILVVFRRSIAAFFANLLASGKYLNNLPTAKLHTEHVFVADSNASRKPTGKGSSMTICEKAARIYKKSPSVHLLVLAVFATFVTGVCGLLFQRFFAYARGNLCLVAVMWIVTGTFLVITDSRGKTRLGLRRLAIWHAVVIGLAQAAAIMPGISRSGATICAAILIGLHRRWAVEFSFLLAIPAVLGAAVIKLVQDFGQIGSGALPVASILTGAAIAAVVGIFALKVLVAASRRANLKFFAFYCWGLAFFVLVYFLR